MASIRPKTLSSGKKAYLVQWTDLEGEPQSKQFSAAGGFSAPWEAAKSFKNEVEAELQRGTYIDPKLGRITFSDYAEQWRHNQLHRAGSADVAERNLRVHINPAFGHRAMSSLRRSDIQALVRGLEDRGYASNTIESVYGTATSVLRSAVLDKIIAESPAREIKLPEPNYDTELIIPTVDQVLSIADAVPQHGRALVLLAATTGLRQGELCGLDRREVDFLGRGRHLRVRRQLRTGLAGPPFMGPPKSRHGYREVPLAEEASRALAAHLAEFPAREHRIPTRKDLDRGVAPEKWPSWSLIFTNSRGTPLRRNAVTSMLTPVLEAHGFPPGSGLHVLRHFFASAQIFDGRSVKAVATWMGNDWHETMRTYAHLWPDDDNRGRSAIDNAFAAAATDDGQTADLASGDAAGSAHETS